MINCRALASFALIIHALHAASRTVTCYTCNKFGELLGHLPG